MVEIRVRVGFTLGISYRTRAQGNIFRVSAIFRRASPKPSASTACLAAPTLLEQHLQLAALPSRYRTGGDHLGLRERMARFHEVALKGRRHRCRNGCGTLSLLHVSNHGCRAPFTIDSILDRFPCGQAAQPQGAAVRHSPLASFARASVAPCPKSCEPCSGRFPRAAFGVSAAMVSHVTLTFSGPKTEVRDVACFRIPR